MLTTATSSLTILMKSFEQIFLSSSLRDIGKFIGRFLDDSVMKGLTYQCWGHFDPKNKDPKIFENYLNPVMLVFIGKVLKSTLRWVPICKGFNHFFRIFELFCIGQSSDQQHKG